MDIEPLTEVPGNKTVQLVVECPLPWCYELRLYDRLVTVPAAASLLDVLWAAAALDPHDFRYVGVTLWWPRVLHLLHGLTLVPTASSAEARPSPCDPAVPPPRFHTQDTSQGPFLTQVLGLEARQEKRNYWQLLTTHNTPLQMGEWWVGSLGRWQGSPAAPWLLSHPEPLSLSLQVSPTTDPEMGRPSSCASANGRGWGVMAMKPPLRAQDLPAPCFLLSVGQHPKSARGRGRGHTRCLVSYRCSGTGAHRPAAPSVLVPLGNGAGGRWEQPFLGCPKHFWGGQRFGESESALFILSKDQLGSSSSVTP